MAIKSRECEPCSGVEWSSNPISTALIVAVLASLPAWFPLCAASEEKSNGRGGSTDTEKAGETVDALPPPPHAEAAAEFQQRQSPLVTSFLEERVLPAYVPAAVELQPGENLTYEIEYGVMNLGEVNMAVVGVSDTAVGTEAENAVERWYDLKLTMKLQTLGMKMKTTLRSRMDAATGACRRYSFSQDDKKKNSREEIAYLPADAGSNLGSRFIYTMKEKSGKLKRYSCVIPIGDAGNATDLLSVFYYMRGMKIEPGKTYPVVVVADGKLWKADIVCKGEKKIDAGAFGKRTSLIVEIRGKFRGVFSNGGRLEILLDKKTGIPLRFNLELSFASGVISLKKAKNSPLNR